MGVRRAEDVSLGGWSRRVSAYTIVAITGEAMRQSTNDTDKCWPIRWQKFLLPCLEPAA